MSFNINALRVSVGGIVASFNTSPTMIGTAIVIHSLIVAGLVMLGAKNRRTLRRTAGVRRRAFRWSA